MVAGGGVVYEDSSGFGAKLMLAMPRPSQRGFEQTVLIGSPARSPDGGFYVPSLSGPGFGGNPGGNPGRPAPRPMRLGTDGSRFVVAVERTSVNTEILVLIDLGIVSRPVRRN